MDQSESKTAVISDNNYIQSPRDHLATAQGSRIVNGDGNTRNIITIQQRKSMIRSAGGNRG